MDERTSRAIAHLAEAVYLLSCVRDQDEQATVPVTIGENQLMVTPKTAEALADAVDSMNAYLDSDNAFDDKLRAAFEQAKPAIDALLNNDEASVARRKVEFMAWVEARSNETIESGEWSAAAVARNNNELYRQVDNLFNAINPWSYLDDVLNSADPEASAAAYEQIVTGEWDGEL